MITPEQFRMARAALKLTQKDVQELCGFESFTGISNLECGVTSSKGYSQTADIVLGFYLSQNIEFIPNGVIYPAKQKEKMNAGITEKDVGRQGEIFQR